MKRRKVHVLNLVLAGLLAFSVLSGCTNGGGADTQPSDSAVTSDAGETDDTNKSGEALSSVSSKDTLIIATENETPSLHSANHNATAGSYMNLLTYNGLFKTDMDLNAVPDLVESYENISDTEWIFKIYEGIKFHNGEEMTAEDVKASLDWAKGFPDVAQYTASPAQVEVVDEYTVKVITDGPAATLLFDLAHHGNYIVPKSLIESDHDFITEPIGSGPYINTSWVRGDKLTFEAFDDYFDKENAPQIKYLEVRIIPEGASRTISLENGEVDFIIEVATTDMDNINNNSNLELIVTPGTTHNYMMINNEVYPFDNQLVRRAVNMAIDKEAVVIVATNGLADVAISQTPFGFPGSTDGKAETKNIELAKQLFEESGVDPDSFVLEIICSNEAKRRAAEVIQSNLLELGITVTIEMMDLATYLSVTSDGDYIASIGNYTASSLIAYLMGVHAGDSVGASNRSRLDDPQVNALIDEAKRTLDPEEQVRVLEEVTELLNEITPQIPLYQDKIIRAHHKDLGGVEVSPSGTIYFNNMYWK